jgi:putative CRISPR-associated protein (TIGR02620 family)
METEVVIVTRHAGAIEWLRRHYPQQIAGAPVLASAASDDVRGKVVVGNIPLHLGAQAAEVWAIEFDGPAPRGAEFTAEDMEAAAARLRRYRVTALGEPEPEASRTVRVIEWADRPGPRGRTSWALVVQDGRVHWFAGEDIPGVVRVLRREHVKEGRWSHDRYRLALSPDARWITGRMGWNTGTLTEGLEQALGRRIMTLGDLAVALGVDLDEAGRFAGELGLELPEEIRV